MPPTRTWVGRDSSLCRHRLFPGEFAKFICIEFKIEDNFVCDLIITDFEVRLLISLTGPFQPEVMYIIGQIIFEPHQICGLLLQGISPLQASIEKFRLWYILRPFQRHVVNPYASRTTDAR